MSRKTKITDFLLQTLTYICASIGAISLFLILFFIFSKGSKLVNLDLITKNYYPTAVSISATSTKDFDPITTSEESVFVEKYGITLTNTKDSGGKDQIKITEVNSDSPLKNAININTQEKYELSNGMIFNKVIMDNNRIGLKNMGIEKIKDVLNSSPTIKELAVEDYGGGIRGSLITTLYLVLITPIFAFPLGIGAAIYLNEYAKKSKFTNFIRQMIELLTGIPSIIYGLLGSALFIPLTMKVFNATGGNIISGALTMAVMLLPIIIRSTEEALKIVPQSYREASYALGANKTQTIFKVIIKASLPGIISGAVLSIGRIFGESAALIYAIGTVVKDEVNLTSQSSTLAVQIWSTMAGETPNFELASAIALIILAVVLILNLFVKLVLKKYNNAY